MHLIAKRKKEIGKSRIYRKKNEPLTVSSEASGIEPDAGVEPATLRLRVSRSTD
ncbi:hypothetical protein GGS20DRAFT_568130 [Poronia punctata]|nr:hypothetical protein GGS20DRAFT_568130 [Poronia punctata]